MKIHSPLLENNAVCGFSRPSAGRLILQRAVLPRDRRPRGGGCQAARGPARLCSVAGGQDPEQRTQPSSEHLSSFPLHRERATFPHPTLLFPAGLHVVFPDGRCPLPSSQQLWALGEGRPCQAHPSPWHAPASQVSVSSRCCDMMTNTHILGDWMRRALCLRVADTSSIMALIRPLRVSGLNFWLGTEFTAS